MAKPPKLANTEELTDFSHWLADTIQNQVARENAGFVEIVRQVGQQRIYVDNGTVKFEISLREVGP